MTTIMIKHANVLVTMDDHRREFPDGGLFIIWKRLSPRVSMGLAG
jgi:hypothetical protein